MIYKIKDELGNTYESSNLQEFCEEHNLTKRLLDYTKLKWENSGKRYQETHKGYKIIEEIAEVSGIEERKAKFEETSDGYIIYGNKRNVEISKDALRKIKKLYCVERLSINKTCLEMELLRQELTLILNAFSITHDDVPYIEEDIDIMSADEMAENTRIEKKRAYYKKLDRKKFEDIEKEIKKYMDKNYLYDKIIEKINPIEPKIMSERFENIESEKYHTFFVTDEHAGLEINSHFNEYNLDIMREKFEKLTDYILSNIECGNLDILLGGDSIMGFIHSSNEKNSTFVTKSIEVLMQCYIDMLYNLSKVGSYNIRVAKANGSHESLKSLKTERTDEENFGKLIWFMLKTKFSEFENIEFIEPLKNSPFTLVRYHNYGRLIGHGDEMSTANYIKFSQQINKNVKYIDLGHFHHLKCEESFGVRVTYNEAMCGSDQYAQKLGLLSESGVRYSMFDNDGIQESKLIRL